MAQLLGRKSKVMEYAQEHNAEVAEKEKREKESKKYFLIEEYHTMAEKDWGDKVEYEISRYTTPEELQQAIIKGPKHQGGVLTPLQKLEAELKLKKSK